MQERVLDIIAEVAELDRGFLQENLRAKNLWESMINIAIILALEEEFDIKFSVEQMMEMKTAQDICECVKANLEQK